MCPSRHQQHPVPQIERHRSGGPVQEQIWVRQLHGRGNSAGHPVVDSLHAAAMLVVPQPLGELGWTPQRLDQLSVAAIHGMLNRHERN